eukprot:8872399-Pyramimonas_sp.AAC.1
MAQDAALAVPLPRERPAPHEALAALLRTDARYGASECAGDIAPFGSAPVSLPGRDLSGVDIYQVLPSDASRKLKRLRDAILLSSEEYALRIKSEGLPNLYFDPALEAQPSKWEGFCRELRGRGLARWTRPYKERVGLLLVRKKRCDSRLICDARRSNVQFDIPGSIQLATGGSLSRLDSSSEQAIYCASFDIKDFFHELRIHEELSHVTRGSGFGSRGGE